MPALLLTEAWWRWRARHGLMPDRLRIAHAAWHLGWPVLGAAMAGWALVWLLPDIALLCARDPMFPLLLLAVVTACGGLSAARRLRAAAREHWLQALPLSMARRRTQQWMLASIRAFTRAASLWLMVYVAVFCVSPQTMSTNVSVAITATVIMLLAGSGGSLLGMQHARVDVLQGTPATTLHAAHADVVSLPGLLWRWQLRRLEHLRPDRHKLLLAALALALPMGTPLGAALLLLASGWLLASAIDALGISRATLLQVLVLTQACTTTPRRWLLAHLPLPLLVLMVSSLLGATAAWVLGLTAHWLPTALLLLVLFCCATLLPTLWQLLRQRRRLVPWR
jgi:hypothetical protein